MVSPVPLPPNPFNPVTVDLPAGSTLLRVYSNRHRPEEFNPGFGEPTRFAFFNDDAGSPVSVLYAAENLEVAVCVTMLHHLPAAGSVLFPQNYRDRIAAALVTTRNLKLASFLGAGLRAFGLDAAQLTDRNAEWYPDTVRWAEAAWTAGFDGCVWTSRRLNPAKSYVFFDRADGAFAISGHVMPKAFVNGPDLDWLIDFCAVIHIDVEVG